MAEQLSIEDPDAVGRCVALLQAGSLVVVPTDTVYAVVADAFQPAATQALLSARRAQRDMPLTVAIRHPRQLTGLSEDDGEASQRLVAAFWPGPLTLVLQAGDALTWDLGDAEGTVAIRLPDDDFLQELTRQVGPLAMSSANTVGADPATTVAAAEVLLGDAVAAYVDGGERAGRPSTIVDVSRGGAEVLRRGAISADDVFDAATGAVDWGAPTESSGPSEPPEAPEDPDASDPADHETPDADEQGANGAHRDR